ncbi:MAG: hypothetical protein ACRBK7_21435 [Acidimicrobiales bacterium]
MTSQYDFSSQHWDHIAMTPVLVGWAVARAEDSGFYGSIKETRTLVSTIADSASANPAGSLIAQAAATDTQDEASAFRSTNPETLAGAAINACRDLMVILAEKAEGEEAQGFADWVLSIAQTVAEAAKEDGVRVSPGESELLDRLKLALTPA